MVISEIRVLPGIDGEDSWPFVELCNVGDAAADLGEYRLDVSEAQCERFTSMQVPAETCVTASFAEETPADVSLDDPACTWAAEQGSVGLYRDGEAAEIIDYVAWSGPDLEYPGGDTHDDAVAAGIWPTGAVFETTRTDEGTRGQTLRHGGSIGRDAQSADTDSPDDWDFSGGVDAVYASPGAFNANGFKIEVDDPADPLPDDPSWVVMVYANADNEVLEDDIYRDLNDLERGLEGDGVQVVVFLDGHTRIVQIDPETGADLPDTRGGTWRAELRHDEDDVLRFHAPPGESVDDVFLGEEQMGDGNTLRGFVQWAMATYPAENHALFASGHGSGWKQFLPDSSVGRATPVQYADRDAIQIGELGDALQDLDLDLLVFDSCHMAMIEVAYEVYEDADVLVASEARVPTDGFPYEAIFAALSAAPTTGDEGFAALIVEQYAAYYESSIYTDWTLSTIVLDLPMRTLSSLVSDMAGALAAVGSQTREPDEVGGLDDHGDAYCVEEDPTDNVQTAVGDALVRSEHFGKEHGDANYTDLADFAGWIACDGQIPATIRELAQEVKREVSFSIVMAEEHGSLYEDATGLSIYFPSAQTAGQPLVPKTDAAEEEPYDEPDMPFVLQAGDDLVKYGPDMDPLSCYQEDPLFPRINAPGFDFVENTSWDAFLLRFYEPVADAACYPHLLFAGGVVECNGSGSSDWDGTITGWSWDLDPDDDTDDMDMDVDCRDESDDDWDEDGEFIGPFILLDPGTYEYTLTVQDDQFLQPGHDQHMETDQDETSVSVYPFYSYLVPTPPYIDLGDPTEPGSTVAVVVEVTNTSDQWLTELQIAATAVDQEVEFVCLPTMGIHAEEEVPPSPLFDLDEELCEPYSWLYCECPMVGDPGDVYALDAVEVVDVGLSITVILWELGPGETFQLYGTGISQGDGNGDEAIELEIRARADGVGEGRADLIE